MATALKLRADIKKLKKALETKGISASVKDKLKTQLEKAEAELAAVKKGKAPKTSSTKGTKTALSKLQSLVKRKKYGAYRAQGVDLKKDADRPALPSGKRKSKSGNTYYEYRANRIDVKQPPKRYPKLEDGGYMAGGGKTQQLYKSIMKDKLKALEEEISTINLMLKKLENENTEESYKASQNLREYKAVLEAKKLNLEDTSKEKGGYMEKGGTIDNSGMTPADLQKQIWNLTARIAKLGDIESQASYDEINMLMKQRKKLQSMALNHGDVVMAKGSETHRYEKGGRVSKNWSGKKGKENWGKQDLSSMYENNLDLVADVFDYYKKLSSEINESYASEMKEEMIQVLKTGNLQSKDGSMLTFASGGYMAKGGMTLGEISKKYDDNEDNNYHTENVVLLAEHFGTDSDLRDAKTIKAKHDVIGSLPYYLAQERDALGNKLYKKMQEQIREKGMNAKPTK